MKPALGAAQPPLMATGALPAQSQAPPPSPEQFVGQLPGLDPATQARLLADLKQTDPAHWPQLLQAFRVAAGRGANPRPTGELPPQSTVDGSPAMAATADVSSKLREHPYHPSERPAAPTTPPTSTLPGEPPTGGLAQAFAANRDPRAALATLNDPLDGDTSAVRQVSYESSASSNAQSAEQAISAAIRELEASGDHAVAGSQEAARRQIELRLLYLAAGRRDDSLKPIPGLTSAEQEFWSSQLYALSAWLDAEKTPAADRRANEALAHLDRARGKLAEIGTLQVRSPEFCTRVDGFGAFTKFKENVFKPSQEVVLYVELENFHCDSTDGGYRTALSSRYRILDSQGRQVTEYEFPAIEEVCQNRRRDYYISFRVTMPGRVYDGRHTLQLTVEDTLGKKVGQTSIEFAIKE
ncbi:MAG: hypothetical protein SGJ19_28540 [Planctomycetia bacterium]|nr:hypothetical protein [Planctomycetia bacterium]